MFPLNIFLLPGEQMPLHIFEPRYRQLFKEAEQEDFRFGLPYEDKELGKSCVSICRLMEVSKRYSSGESDVIIEATALGILKKFNASFPSKEYPGGSVEVLEELSINSLPDNQVLEAFSKYIYLKHGNEVTIESLSHYRLVDIASSLTLGNTDKLKLISFSNAQKQNAFLLRNLKYYGLLLEQENGIENGLILN